MVVWWFFQYCVPLCLNYLPGLRFFWDFDPNCFSSAGNRCWYPFVWRSRRYQNSSTARRVFYSRRCYASRCFQHCDSSCWTITHALAGHGNVCRSPGPRQKLLEGTAQKRRLRLQQSEAQHRFWWAMRTMLFYASYMFVEWENDPRLLEGPCCQRTVDLRMWNSSI